MCKHSDPPILPLIGLLSGGIIDRLKSGGIGSFLSGGIDRFKSSGTGSF